MAAVSLSPQNQPNTSMASGGWPRYVVFLLDQSGVLHDGTSPYPRAVEALSAMKRAGNTIVLISNSGKRAGLNESRLLSSASNSKLGLLCLLQRGCVGRHRRRTCRQRGPGAGSVWMADYR
jgi:hypothetical protein